MAENHKTPVWLFSTRDIDLIDNSIVQPFMVKENDCESININSIGKENYEPTLKDFYALYNNGEYDATIIKEFISRNPQFQVEKETAHLFEFVYQLKNNNIFITRCYPSKLNTHNIPQQYQERIGNVFWLKSYMNSVAEIIGKKINEICFFGLLHKDDIPIRNIENYNYFFRTFSHNGINNYFYNNYINCENFLSSIECNDKVFELVKLISFNDLDSKISGLKNDNQTLDEDNLIYLLGTADENMKEQLIELFKTVYINGIRNYYGDYK